VAIKVRKEIIKIKNLFFKYPKTEKYALKNVSLSINEGDFILVTGHGGAGKTTLCLAMTGLIPSLIPGEFNGNVEVCGKDTRSAQPHELAKDIGIVFQEPETQFFTSSVENDIAFPLENLMTPREEIRERIENILRIMKLEPYREKTPYKLSGGEKQRVATGIGLALRPKIMIYDEATSSLDPVGKYDVIETIKSLHETYNITSILVTHDIEETIEYANRMVVLEQGEIILDGTPKEVVKKAIEMKSGIKYPTVSELGYLLNKKGYKMEIPITLKDIKAEFQKYIFEKMKAERIKKEEVEYGIQGLSPIVEVEDLEFFYPNEKIPALKRINLKIFPGEFISIIGSNGSGKTTLMKLIAGLLKPTKGKIKIKGEDIKNKSISELCKLVGYVYQYPEDQIFSSTVSEEIGFGPKNLGWPKDEVEKIVQDIAKKLGITDILDFSPFFLSRPEKRIVTLASILSMNPDILLLDEPTTGQDWQGSKKILELVRNLNKEGKTVILVTHDIRLVCEYANRVVVMLNGEVLMDEPVRKTFAKREILKKACVEVPQCTRLFHDLFGETVLTVEEAQKIIENYLKL